MNSSFESSAMAVSPASRPSVARAAVFTGPGCELALRDLPLRAPGPGEAVVQIDLATICGSDLSTMSGRRSGPAPCVLGHEMVGRLQAIGPGGLFGIDGEALQIGQRVTWSVAASCGVCSRCRRDLPQKCRELFKYGHARLEEGDMPTGGMATHCHLRPGTPILSVNDTLPDEVVAPANCATATVAAAFRRAGFEPGQNLEGMAVVVFGAGMLGLTAVAMASLRGASAIVVVDPWSTRQAWATDFGAHATLADPSEPALRDALAHQGAHDGATLVLELSGAPEAPAAGLAALGLGGTMILAGGTHPTPAWSIDPEAIVRRMLSIRGLHNYAPRDLVTALEFLERWHDDPNRGHQPASLVESIYALEDVNQAVAARGGAIRVGVRPS